MEFFPVSYYQHWASFEYKKFNRKHETIIIQEKHGTKKGVRWKYVTIGIAGVTALATYA